MRMESAQAFQLELSVATRSKIRSEEAVMITVTAEQAQKRFGKLLESVSRGERIVVTRKGKPVAEMRSPENHDADTWMLTDEEAAKLDKLTAEAEAAGTMKSFGSAEEMVEYLRKRLKIPKRLFAQARRQSGI